MSFGVGLVVVMLGAMRGGGMVTSCGSVYKIFDAR